MAYLKTPLITYGRFPWRLFLLVSFFRLVDFIWVQSYFVPDEYWQSLEIAHLKVFGFGQKTWEWREGIRSYFYPGLFAGVYQLLKWAGLDSVVMVVGVPRALQGIMSAVADVYFLRWVHERRNGQYSWAFISWATTSFINYCSTRTLINTFEMNLTIIALYYYPWTPKTRSLPFIIIATLVSYIRPTSIITWTPLVLINLVSSPKTMFSYLFTAPFVVGALVGLDSFFHSSLLITPWNFIKFNLHSSITEFYGTHDPFWYFYGGIPAVLGLQTIPFFIGLFRAAKSLRRFRTSLEAQLVITILWTLSILNVMPHKEFRFILPLVPMMIYLSSGVLSRWSSTASYSIIYIIGVILIGVHTSSLIFFGRFHQTGQLETMSTLATVAKNEPNAKIHFLAGCHKFPGYSHLHHNVSTRYISCEPNLKNDSNYIDETEFFHNNTKTWLNEVYSASRPCALPTHIVTFDSLNITNFLYARNFSRTHSISHNEYFPPQPYEGRFVHIYRRKGARC